MNLQTYWYQDRLHPLLLPLLPLSAAFGLVTRLRRWSYRCGLNKARHFALPIIVVGNISVGGTGKTPLVIALAKHFKEQGKNPGIALRGVGGQEHLRPIRVKSDSNPFEAGDEAALIAKNTSCPVIACVDRPAAVEALQQAGCDLVLCDDGLQHYRLARKVEIAVVDGSRYFGNGRLLPAGPLREPLARLREVDFIVVNEPEKGVSQLAGEKQRPFSMRLIPGGFQAVHQAAEHRAPDSFRGQKAHAVAGIGNPQRFFESLTRLGVDFIPHRFPDHHPFQDSDLNFSDTLPVLMTEKDAIKCKTLTFADSAKARQWYLRVEAELSPEFKQALADKLKGE